MTDAQKKVNNFTFFQPLREIMYLQGFKENPWAYSSFAPKITKGHIGIDVAYGDGDPVRAFFDGKITYANLDSIVQVCKIDGSDYEIVYSHGRNRKVGIGTEVKAGDEICEQGYEGPSVMYDSETSENEKLSWSHLHFGIRPIELGIKQEKEVFWNFAKFSIIPYRYIESDEAIDHFVDPKKFSRQILHKVAEAIIKKENMAKFHSENNNPGALRYSPLEIGQKGGFSVFRSLEEGYSALIRQLSIAADNDPHNSLYKANMTVYEFFSRYAPGSDGNDPKKYADDVVQWVGLRSISDPISDWMLTELEWVIKYNNYPWSYPENIVAKDKDIGIMISIVKLLKATWNLVTRDKGRK